MPIFLMIYLINSHVVDFLNKYPSFILTSGLSRYFLSERLKLQLHNKTAVKKAQIKREISVFFIKTPPRRFQQKFWL